MRALFFVPFTFVVATACSPQTSELPVGGDFGGDRGTVAGDQQAADGDSPAGDLAGHADSALPSDESLPGDGDAALPLGEPGPTTSLPAHIIAFAVPQAVDGRAADGGDGWVDIRVNDAAALGANWRLMAATYSYVTLQLDASQLPWTISDGETLRSHSPAYVGATDVSMADNNANRWDFRTVVSFPINIKHGAIWIEDSAGNVVDLVTYETGLNQGDWLTADALAVLQTAVSAGAWNSAAATGAFLLADADVDYAVLVHPEMDGDSAFDWGFAGGPRTDYYADAHGKSGAELKAALNLIIKAHTMLPYADLKSAFTVTDRDPANVLNVIQFYTGFSTGADFNREHIWAKSHGGFTAETQAGFTDLHHLRPTRPDVNSKRWHLDFDNGGVPYSNSGSFIVTDLSWEPRAAVKGDVARMLFYMVVRYEGNEGGMPDLELVEAIPSLLDSSGNPNNHQHASTPRIGRRSTLLAWHVQDPPDDEERRRNEVIFTDFQHNRNPFIDHPEWVYEIWGGPIWPSP